MFTWELMTNAASRSSSLSPLFFCCQLKDSFQWLYDTAADTWSDSLEPTSKHRLENGGFYAQRVKGFDDLIAISLNMNFGDPENWWLLADSTDPYGMLQWLSDTLQKAEDNGDKVRKKINGSRGYFAFLPLFQIGHDHWSSALC